MIRVSCTSRLAMILFVFCIVCTVFISNISAAPIITGYDIEDGLSPTFGGWGPISYSGTITNDGTGYDYVGGGGTLNDNLIGSGESEAHLFDILDLSPTITIYLDNTYDLWGMSLLSWTPRQPPLENSIPGNLVSLTINGFNFNTVPTGPGTIAHPEGVNEMVDLSSLTDTDTVVLSNFVTQGSRWFAIGEIVFTDHGEAPIPEPATVALLGIGLAGLAGAEARRRRRKKKAVD